VIKHIKKQKYGQGFLVVVISPTNYIAKMLLSSIIPNYVVYNCHISHVRSSYLLVCIQLSPVFPRNTEQYVLDGGSLLHKIDCPKKSTYIDITSYYLRYVANKFEKCTIVFDGYPEDPTTKDNIHNSRVGTAVSSRIEFEKTMIFTGKKYTFLKDFSEDLKYDCFRDGRIRLRDS
jgi:hypothetical protein